jgi:hypothetical protein
MDSLYSKRVSLLAELQSNIDSGSFDTLRKFNNWLIETGALRSGVLEAKDLELVLQTYIHEAPKVQNPSSIDTSEW